MSSTPTWAAVVTVDTSYYFGTEYFPLVESLYEQEYGEELTVKVLPESELSRRYELADIVTIAMGLSIDFGRLSDVLMPLDPYLAMLESESGYGEGIYSAAIDAMRHECVTWVLPLTGTPLGVLYNADLLKAAGLEPPRPDCTWDDLVSLAASVGLLPMHQSSIDAFVARWGDYAEVLHYFLRRPVVSIENPQVPQQYRATVVNAMARVVTGAMGVEECLDYLEPAL